MLINFDKLKLSASMEVLRIANQLRKEGKRIYPLSIGDTHFPPPKIILEKIKNLPASFSHYTNANGIDRLRDQIASSINGYQMEDVIIVPGLKQGLFYLLHALQNKTVCILEPAWLGYQATAAMTGYKYVVVNTHHPDWLDKLAKQSFDTIIVCAPNNPDGKIFNELETNAILFAAKKNNAWLITDLIYERFDYTKSYQIFFDKIAIYDKLVIGNGFSKSHAMTGFRIGYLIFKDTDLLKKISLLQQNIATCTPAISQYLLLDFEKANSEIDEYVTYYKQNRASVLDIFPEWETAKPDGGFYYFINLAVYGITDAGLFCKELLSDTGIALVPGGAYGKGFDSYIRLSFSIERSELEEALLKLKNYITK